MKVLTCIGIGLVVSFSVLSVCAQSARSWTAHTSAREVTGMSAGEGMVWVASTGGIFGYNPGSGEIERYTAAEGLYDVNVQAVVWDSARQFVWIGYADGVFDRLEITSGEITAYFDIYRSERFPFKVINAMEVQGDSLLIATGFGLVVFDPVRNEVRDTYSRFGALPAATPVNDVIVNQIPDGGTGIWVGTDAGIAYAPLSGRSLQDPGSWTSESTILPVSQVTDIVYHHGHLYVGTPFGMGRRMSAGNYQRVGNGTREILDFGVLDDHVLAVTPFRLRAYDIHGRETILVGEYQDLRAVSTNNAGDVWLGDAGSGLNHYRQGTEPLSLRLVSKGLYPEGPFDSPFGDLAVSSDGSLWAAAQPGISGAGFYRMDSSEEWTNFTGRFFEELAGRGSYWRVHVDGAGIAWAGSRGAGLAQVSPGDVITTYDQNNSTLLPAAGTQNYIIVGGVASEEDGTLWVTNTTSPYPLHVRTPDGAWVRLLPPSCNGATQTSALGNILIDSNGIKWIILLDRGNLRITQGLLILDTNETPEDAADDVCTYYATPGSNGAGLPGTQIHTLAEDLNGRVWVGTSGGPAYFQSGTFAANDPALQAVWPVWKDRTFGTYVLRGLGVNDIAVDPSNRLWMATPDGIYLISESDGYRQIAHYKSDNSPLFSDVVTTVAVEGASGRVFLGTDKGLISVLSDAIQPSERTRDLFIYPNPAEVATGADPQIYIEGLVSETEISVMAVHGELVRRMQARGGRGIWDGRDQDGRLVPSGMYLIVASGKNGEGVAYGKVAIIH